MQGPLLANYSQSFIEQLRNASSPYAYSTAGAKRRLSFEDKSRLQRFLLWLQLAVKKRMLWGEAAARRRRKHAVILHHCCQNCSSQRMQSILVLANAQMHTTGSQKSAGNFAHDIKHASTGKGSTCQENKVVSDQLPSEIGQKLLMHEQGFANHSASHECLRAHCSTG